MDRIMKKLIAGNWKMNGSLQDACELCIAVMDKIEKNGAAVSDCEFLICPPALHIGSLLNYLKDRPDIVKVGAQDCAAYDNGAYTGEISAAMFADIGCEYVIIGHSERRHIIGEGDEIIVKKVKKAIENGLRVILCVGETQRERDKGSAKEIVAKQLEAVKIDGINSENLVIAYEPVWAIGTGNAATVDDVKKMHAFIRAKLKEMLADSDNLRILYGGSVKVDNAAQLLNIENVNGALIGGASLDAKSFVDIAKAAN